VLHRTELPPPKKRGHSPQLAHAYCDQTAGCISIPLGTEVGLGQADIVLDEDPAPPKRGTAPIFGPCLLWPNGWMDQDATWYGCRPRPSRHCVRWGPAHPPQWARPPNFRSMSIVANGRPPLLLLSSCCTAHGRGSLYFRMGRPLPSKLVADFNGWIWTPI